MILVSEPGSAVAVGYLAACTFGNNTTLQIIISPWLMIKENDGILMEMFRLTHSPRGV